MPIAYDKKTLTLAAATAARLSDLLVAEGYTGSLAGGAFLELEDVNSLGDVYHGDSSAVSNTTGSPLTLYTRQGYVTRPVDPGSIWLYSVGGGDVRCTYEPL